MTEARRRWIRRVAEHGAVAAVSQVLIFTTGVLVVRDLPKDEYALYAICLTIIASMTQLSDSGISSALMSRGASLLDNEQQFFAFVQGAHEFRRRVGVVVTAIGIAWVAVLLARSGAGTGEILEYSSLTVLIFGPVLVSGILQTVLRLTLDIRTLQRNQLVVNSTRLILVALLSWRGLLNVTTGLIVGVTCAVLTVWIMSTRMPPRPVSAIPISKEVRRAHRAVFAQSVRHTLPMTSVLILAEQFFLFLVVTQATPEVVAEMAALSRFGAAFVIVNLITADIAAPLIARTQPVASRIFKRMAGVVLVYLLAILLLVLTVYLLAGQLLALLGPQYTGLRLELTIFALGYGIANLGYAMDAMNLARGWVSLSWTYGIFVGAWLIIVVIFLDLSDIHYVAIAFAGQCSASVLTQVARLISGLRAMRRDTKASTVVAS